MLEWLSKDVVMLWHLLVFLTKYTTLCLVRHLLKCLAWHMAEEKTDSIAGRGYQFNKHSVGQAGVIFRKMQVPSQRLEEVWTEIFPHLPH